MRKSIETVAEIIENPAPTMVESEPTIPVKINLLDKLLLRVMAFFSISKITNHLIKIGIAGAVLVMVTHFMQVLHLGKAQDYAGLTVQLAIAYQIIRSSRYSLLLPTMACGAGLAIATHLSDDETLFGFSQLFYGHMATVGLLGLLVATFTLIEEDIPLSLHAIRQLRYFK